MRDHRSPEERSLALGTTKAPSHRRTATAGTGVVAISGSTVEVGRKFPDQASLEAAYPGKEYRRYRRRMIRAGIPVLKSFITESRLEAASQFVAKANSAFYVRDVPAVTRTDRKKNVLIERKATSDDVRGIDIARRRDRRHRARVVGVMAAAGALTFGAVEVAGPSIQFASDTKDTVTTFVGDTLHSVGIGGESTPTPDTKTSKPGVIVVTKGAKPSKSAAAKPPAAGTGIVLVKADIAGIICDGPTVKATIDTKNDPYGLNAWATAAGDQRIENLPPKAANELWADNQAAFADAAKISDHPADNSVFHAGSHCHGGPLGKKGINPPAANISPVN